MELILVHVWVQDSLKYPKTHWKQVELDVGWKVDTTLGTIVGTTLDSNEGLNEGFEIGFIVGWILDLDDGL